MKYLDYDEQVKMLQGSKKVQVGTKISCQGIISQVKEIYYSDRYVEPKGDVWCVFYDVEFRDTDGILRNWKSYYDGGHIVE